MTEQTELTKEEKKLIYCMCNSYQIQMLERIMLHKKSFEILCGELSPEHSEWIGETNNEYKILQSIKNKVKEDDKDGKKEKTSSYNI